MKYLNRKLLTVMTSLIMVMSVPAAFGQGSPNTHGSDAFPLSPVTPNTLLQFQSVNNAPPSAVTADIRSSAIAAIYLAPGNPGNFQAPISPEPDPTIAVGTSCVELTPDTANGEQMWFLYHDNGAGVKTRVTAEHVDIGVNTPSTLWFDSISPTVFAALNPAAVPGDGFGSGSPATANGDGTPGTLIQPAIGAGFYYWQKIDSSGNLIAGADVNNKAGTIVYLNCAYIDANSDDDWGGASGAGAESRNVVAATVDINANVGGESLPLSSTALLMAGAYTNALWILPILGLAGTVLVIRKLEA